ncbi:MAG: hypothetical protein JWM89_897 [Acidimicrobiales bacterium]|nr:hypothetical protein [Acidimicrobiales bacterium]
MSWRRMRAAAGAVVMPTSTPSGVLDLPAAPVECRNGAFEIASWNVPLVQRRRIGVADHLESTATTGQSYCRSIPSLLTAYLGLR